MVVDQDLDHTSHALVNRKLLYKALLSRCPEATPLGAMYT